MFCSVLKKTKVILKSNTLVPLLCIRSLQSVLTVCKMHLISFVSRVRKILSGTWGEKGRRRKWKRRVYRKWGKGTGSTGGLGKIRRFYNAGLSPVQPSFYLAHSSLIKHNELCLSKKRQGNRNSREKQGDS